MVKGGLLKVRARALTQDDTDLGKIGARAVRHTLTQGQQFMVLGAAGELPQAPAKPVQFLEDMPEDEVAQAVRRAR